MSFLSVLGCGLATSRAISLEQPHHHPDFYSLRGNYPGHMVSCLPYLVSRCF